MAMDSQGAQRPGLMLLKQKHHKVPLKSFLGYHANGHEGLEGAHQATETSCIPLLLENQALTILSQLLVTCEQKVRRLAHSHILIIYTWAVRGFSSIVKEEGFSCEQCGARLSMKWGGFMDGMGIFEQKNEERRGEEERKQEGRRRGREGEREKLRRGKGRGEWV